MHVFVTGGTGLIGSAVVPELLSNGHTVTALARSDSSARAIEVAGGSVVRGSLADVDVIRSAVEQADGVIHLAFANDFSSTEALDRAIGEETAALTAMGDALEGSNRPMVVASATPWVTGRASTEADPVLTEGPLGGRGRAVDAILALAARGVRASAVRLPRTVHNDGNGGFAGLIALVARQTGIVGYPGDGSQRWPAVHVLDAAVLFRLALESAPAGSVWHAVDDEGDRVRDIAEVIGRRLALPVEVVPADAFGLAGPILELDQPASSAATRAALGWQPTYPSLLADLDNLRP